MKSVLLIVLLFTSASAWAAREDSELSHLITVGAGISSPSVEGAISDNPSGLIFNAGAKLLPSLRWGGGSTDYAGDIFLGNGSVGAGIGYGRIGQMNVVEYGLGVSMEILDLSFGVGGTYQFDNAFEGSELNLGALYRPHGKVSIGATAYGVLNGIDAWGAGVAFELGPNASLAIDGATDTSFNGYSLKPGLGVHLRELQLSVSYGFALDNAKRGARIIDGTSIGLGVRLSDALHLRGYYNQISKYYLGLMIRI